MSNLSSYDRIWKKHRYKELQNLFNQKKYKAFIREANSYLDLYNNDGTIRYMRAKSYRQLGYFDLAIEDLKYNLTFSNQPSTLFSLFYLYYYLKRYDEALKLLPVLYKISPQDKIQLNILKAVIKKI